MIRQQIREELKINLKEYVEAITEKSQGKMYICPLCGSGTGKNKTGAFSIKETSWKCFSCDNGGDIFDLIRLHEGIPNHNEQLQRAGELFGYRDILYTGNDQYQNPPETERVPQEMEGYSASNHHSEGDTGSLDTEVVKTPQRMKEDHYAASGASEGNEAAERADYTSFFLQAHRDIDQTDYWQQRGLSRDIVDRFQLGYVAEWRHPEVSNSVPTSPRLIIPTSEGSYLARDTRDDIPHQQKPYDKSKVGRIHFFNRQALQNATKPIFIVEGEIDALSIIEAGGEAVALGTTTMIRSFIRQVEREKPAQLLIVALDNDESGQRATRELAESLKDLQIPFCCHNPYGVYKDANKALQSDREAFVTAVSEAANLRDQAEQMKADEYQKNSTAHYIQDFLDGIAKSVNTPSIPTGFNRLDSVLDGGLYEGLYVIGAISSLGKTTLVTQIGDQIAQTGTDVLIFSLEMARNELMAKSISRHTLQIILATGGDIKNAKTARGITAGKRYAGYNQTEKELINDAVRDYSEYAGNVYISEGVGNIGAEQIKETVKDHISYTGKTPVVIVDYLQILAPHNERATDKQNTDKAVMELKRVSRDFKTPIIGISSFNRANYRNAVTMEAFKESGAIEYSSDVLIGLQLKGSGKDGFNENEAKRRNPREIELVILKNRSGRTGDTLNFNYYPLFNYFEEHQ